MKIPSQEKPHLDNLKLKTTENQNPGFISPIAISREPRQTSLAGGAPNPVGVVQPFYQLSKELCAAYVRTNPAEVDTARRRYLCAILDPENARPETVKIHFHYAVAQIIDAYRKRLGIYEKELQSVQESFEAKLQKVETAGDMAIIFQETLQHLVALTLKPVRVSQTIRLEGAKKYISENFKQDLHLEEVARENGFSVSVFGRAFKREFKMGFSAYLRKIRLEEAKKLLVSTRLPISQVIQESGFSNPQYFFDLFKRSTGYTPQKFRDSFDRC